jgi:hypothetical protein
VNVDLPRILAVLPRFSPSTMITVVKPLLNLHRARRVSARIVLESQARPTDIEWAEAVVFCRNTEPRYAPLLGAIQSRRRPLIYDLDDNLLDLPPGCQGSSPARDAARRAMLQDCLRAAALVRVYSQTLADRVAGLNPHVVRMFAPVDLSLVPAAQRATGNLRPAASGRPDSPAEPIKIVYATPRAPDSLCEIFLPAMERILSHYAGRVEAHFWGYRPPQVASLPNVRYHGLICHYDRFLRHFSRGGFDIGLAPLPDALFFHAKTNNKFREYGACGIAGIYSHSPVYAECVEQEASGLLVANDSASWYDAIARLIDDEVLRTRIQQRARQYVCEHYAQEKFESLFLAQLHDVLGRSDALSATVAGTAAPRSAPVSGPQAETPGFAAGLRSEVRQALHAMRRMGFHQTWSTLRWFLSDRCLATWLRWQLRRPARPRE